MAEEKIRLKSGQGTIFECSIESLKHSSLISNMISACTGSDTNEILELNAITTNILKLVVEWCNHHKTDCFDQSIIDSRSSKISPNEIEPLTSWDENFLKLEQSTLMELILAADYLMIEPLKDMCCKVVASWIPGKSPDQLRKLFNIVNDFDPKEEEKIQLENMWCS
ncbi:MAG: suppressor of kinetochore protein mutant [Marteilia pararefringens]